LERLREEAEDEAAALSNGSDEEDDDKDEEAADIEGNPLVLLSGITLLTLKHYYIQDLGLGLVDQLLKYKFRPQPPLLHLYQLRVLQQPSPGYVTLLRSPIE
jgi:hypothetical protein